MSLSDELLNAYHSTTAKRHHRPTREHYEHIARGLIRRFGPWLPNDRTTPTVDLACGCGELIFALQTLGFTDVRGVDICAEELEHARRFVRGELQCMDVIEWLESQPEGSLGFITAVNIIEHIPRDRLPRLFRAIHRALRVGGTLVAEVPNATSPFGNSTLYGDLTHQLAFTPNSVRQLAELTGFGDDVEFSECGPIPHGVKSAIRYGLWKGMRAAIAAWFLIEIGSTRGMIYTMDMLFRLRRTG